MSVKTTYVCDICKGEVPVYDGGGFGVISKTHIKDRYFELGTPYESEGLHFCVFCAETLHHELQKIFSQGRHDEHQNNHNV